MTIQKRTVQKIESRLSLTSTPFMQEQRKKRVAAPRIGMVLSLLQGAATPVPPLFYRRYGLFLPFWPAIAWPLPRSVCRPERFLKNKARNILSIRRKTVTLHRHYE